MLKTILILCSCAFAYGADDPWSKVKSLKTGTDLQVYRRGSTQPLQVKMDELTNENLVVISKNSQTAIARDEIERIDARSTGRTRSVNHRKECRHRSAVGHSGTEFAARRDECTFHQHVERRNVEQARVRDRVPAHRKRYSEEVGRQDGTWHL